MRAFREQRVARFGGWLVSIVLLAALLQVEATTFDAGAPVARAAAVEPGPAAKAGPLRGRTNTPGDHLNLRTCPSTGCSVLRTVPHGTVLRLGPTSGDWFRTSYGGATGWVSSWYLALIGNPATTVSRGRTGRRMTAYTFDAGSDLGHAPAILDFLQREGIRATFGMTGTWAVDHPSAVRRIATHRHQIMNHTWSHRSFTGYSTKTAALSPAARTGELRRLDRKVKALTGRTTRPAFRPPHGDYNAGVLNDVGANGYRRNVMWSLDSLGWQGLSAAAICDRVIRAVDADPQRGNGFILLFHVGSASKDAEALPCMTTRLRDRGFSFGTVRQVTAS
jgi:peptidoglycan/xylan/chitin deacetylase (PgdA/CDA1 family)